MILFSNLNSAINALNLPDITSLENFLLLIKCKSSPKNDALLKFDLYEKKTECLSVIKSVVDWIP